MTRAEKQTESVFPLAAASCLPETRVWGSNFQKQTFIGASAWLSSTSRWGCGYACDGTTSGSLEQRFYASTYGRFNTPDPFGGSAKLRNPMSWNRYSYTLGDPVNGNDPSGLDCDSGDPEDYSCIADGGYGGTTTDAVCECTVENSDPVISTTTTAVVCPAGLTYSNITASGAGFTGSCDNPIGINQPFVTAMEQYLSTFSMGITISGRLGVPDTPVQTGGTLTIDSNTGVKTSPSTVVKLPLPTPFQNPTTGTNMGSIGTSISTSSPTDTYGLPVGTAVTYKGCGQLGVNYGIDLGSSRGYLNLSFGYYMNLSCP